MTEKDLAPLPAGFVAKTPPEQFERDAAALERLGYLAEGACVTDVGATEFRQAVAAYQASTRGALKVDGLIGPKTRAAIAATLPADEFGAAYIQAIGSLSDGPTRIYTHAQARADLARAYRDEFGTEPTDGELDFGLAIAYFESGYGRAGAASWAALGQFARWASEGLYNWGALQTSQPGPDRREGKDAGRRVFFFVYPSDYLAARAMLRSLAGGARAPWRAAAASGSAFSVAAAMKRAGYFEGFHVGPGELGTNGRTKERGFVEEESKAIAEQKNIADYAGALERYRKIVTQPPPAGVPDPSPLPQGPAGSALGGLIAGAIIGGTILAGWYLAGRA